MTRTDGPYQVRTFDSEGKERGLCISLESYGRARVVALSMCSALEDWGIEATVVICDAFGNQLAEDETDPNCEVRS